MLILGKIHMHRARLTQFQYYASYKIIFMQCLFVSFCPLTTLASVSSDMMNLLTADPLAGLEREEMKEQICLWLSELKCIKSDNTDVKLATMSEGGMKKLYLDLQKLVDEIPNNDSSLKRIAKSLFFSVPGAGSEDTDALQKELESFKTAQVREAEEMEKHKKLIDSILTPGIKAQIEAILAYGTSGE